MDALIMAGGRGSRMGPGMVEKPMLEVGGRHIIDRVVEAVSGAEKVSRVLVSVSDNTPRTEEFLHSIGVETIRTSGADFMEDMHSAFEVLDSDLVLTCPSDMPMLKSFTVDSFIRFFSPEMESAIAVVDYDTVVNTGITPSFSIEIDGSRWVLSGLCISDRRKTLDGVYLRECYMKTDWPDLAVNVNTPYELRISRAFFGEPCLSR